MHYRDAKCGKIQCQGGANRPVIGTNAVSIETNIPLQEGGRILCRGTHVYLGDDMPDPGLVLTGTKCGDSMVSMFETHKTTEKILENNLGRILLLHGSLPVEFPPLAIRTAQCEPEACVLHVSLDLASVCSVPRKLSTKQALKGQNTTEKNTVLYVSRKIVLHHSCCVSPPALPAHFNEAPQKRGMATDVRECQRMPSFLLAPEQCSDGGKYRREPVTSVTYGLV